MNQYKLDKNKPAQESNEEILLRGFDRSLPMSLLKAREAVMKKFTPTLKEHGLSAQQWRVIRSLEQEDGLEISELSKRCFLLLPSMSRIVQNLEARELIVRKAVSTDQRRTALYLTDQARGVYQDVAPKSAERYKNITQRFGYGKLELLYELLDDLIEVLDEPNEK
jgi:homoprotocatechuate degradation regulator HpaR